MRRFAAGNRRKAVGRLHNSRHVPLFSPVPIVEEIDANRACAYLCHRGCHAFELVSRDQVDDAPDDARVKPLGDHVFEKFLANKRIEWDNYRTYVTDYELKKYLPIL